MNAGVPSTLPVTSACPAGCSATARLRDPMILGHEVSGVVAELGAGKSVLLKLIGGVIEADFGEVHVEQLGDGEVPEVGFLFQEGALFDSMTVLQNVAFPLLEGYHDQRAEQCDYDDAVSRSYEILCQVGLGRAYKKFPGQLSGGMRRRVALARALVHRPE